MAYVGSLFVALSILLGVFGFTGLAGAASGVAVVTASYLLLLSIIPFTFVRRDRLAFNTRRTA